MIDFQGSGAVSGYETLGAGLQSMLTTDLAASHSIAVVERTKLAALRQEMKLSRSAAADPKTALRVGKLAGATHLVTGTFTLVGKELRLDARAIEIATGRVVLATDAKGERDAFFELEKKLASAIVAGIGVSLSPKERASMARIQTADFEAFRRFGDGLSLFDDADYDKSLEALREASTRDQDFGLARTTLDTYQKMANEIRSRADVLDAEKRVQSAQARRQLRADEQAVIDRLMAVAARKGPGERKQRAAALYCAIRILSDAMEDEGLDRFARMRLRDALVTRYVREADGLFPDMPMVPFQPMGERWGGPDAPKSPADVDRAVAAAIDRFARYGQNPVKDAKEIQSAKEEHLQSIFSRTFKETAASMHLDYRAASDLLDRFYATGARFSPAGRWRVGALETRAERRRWLLDVDASTRLYKEASTIETSPGSLRHLAEEVDSNAGIAEVLASGRPDPCLREWVLAVLTQGPSTVRRRMEQDGKLASLCASDYVKTDRHRFHSGDLLDTLPVWLWGPSNGRPTYGGPQKEPGRFEDLRFLGKDRDLDGRAPWSAAIVEGVPRAGAALALELHYDLPADSPCRPNYDCPLAGATAGGDGLLRCRKCRGARAPPQRQPRRCADGSDRRRARRQSRAARRPARAAGFRALSDDGTVGDGARAAGSAAASAAVGRRCQSRSAARLGAWWCRPPGTRPPSMRPRQRAASWASWSRGTGSCALSARVPRERAQIETRKPRLLDLRRILRLTASIRVGDPPSGAILPIQYSPALWVDDSTREAMIRSVESADRRETNWREESLAALGDDRGGTVLGRGRRHERRTRHDGDEPSILIVEDDRAIREPLSVLLRGEGYRVSLAENGQEALRKLRTEPSPDIIVLDLRMPVMDGWEFRAIQQQDPVLGLIPVVAISADGSAQAVTMSADAYLRKPLDPSDLLQTIEGILREQEWQAMSSRLEEAEHLASLGRVAAAVGHEINNPLAFVVLNLDQSLAQLRAVGGDGLAEATAMLEICQTGLERIRRTVGNLQRLSRADDEVRGAVEIAKVLDQAIAMAWNQIRHRARFVTRVDEILPIQGNAGALEQVFLNLLVNAVQAIPEGHAEQNEIRITARACVGHPTGEVMVEIRDTGSGIAPDLQARIFEPFFTTKPAGVGTGLGLLHQPPDRDRSRRARGDRERGREGHGVPGVPASGRAARRRGRRRRHRACSRRPRCAAACWSSTTSQRSAPRSARRCARSTTSVVTHRAIDALGRLREGETFDLVLCDLVMPEIGGPEVYAAIAERWPKLIARMVFMTGGAFTEATGNFIERVRPHVFPKPFRLDELRALVRRRLIMLRS